jgi:hypothetical protein
MINESGTAVILREKKLNKEKILRLLQLQQQHWFCTGLPDGSGVIPKILIWVYFGRPSEWKMLVNFTEVWYHF